LKRKIKNLNPFIDREYRYHYREYGQAATILRWALAAEEGSSRLGVLWGLPPLSLVDMLHVIGGGFGS
jgi:hypothetical protein